MKTPVVFRRAMAMNESVAATCCYRMVTSSTNYYNEVLNGGSLETGPASALQWDPAVSRDWAQLDYDVDFSGYAGLRAVPVFNSLKQRWWVLFFRDDRIASASPLDDFAGVGAQVAVANPGCTHDSETCLYLAEAPIASLFNHTGATRAHSTVDSDWAMPHAAQQFHS